MIGIVADDITGANDIGAMFAEAGYETHVVTRAAGAPLRLVGQPEVVIVDTDSRYCSPSEAYRRVAEATRSLRLVPCDRFFKKTCSVFRGNVGPEFDAMMETLGRDFAGRMIVVPGYPSNNRTTAHGIQYVFEQRLEDSHFRNDPVHPMTSSNIVEILRSQTPMRVEHVDTDDVGRGPDALRTRLSEMPENVTYVLFDVADQASLRTVAEACRDERVFGGSAGLASELAPLWKPGGKAGPPPALEGTGGLGIPVIAGSLTPMTAEQVKRLERRGAARVTLNAYAVFRNNARDAEVERVGAATADLLRAGKDAVVVTPVAPDAVTETVEQAARLGLSEAEAGRLISDALGEATAYALRKSGQNRLLAAGGDTSAAVCSHLGIRALRVGSPIEPGLPLCTGFSDPRVRLVLKVGSMGTPDFIVHAVEALRAS